MERDLLIAQSRAPVLWQGFIETEAVKLAREKPKEKLTEPEKKLTKKPEKSG